VTLIALLPALNRVRDQRRGYNHCAGGRQGNS
jgi:hypothetical protein